MIASQHINQAQQNSAVWGTNVSGLHSISEDFFWMLIRKSHNIDGKNDTIHPDN